MSFWNDPDSIPLSIRARRSSLYLFLPPFIVVVAFLALHPIHERYNVPFISYFLSIQKSKKGDVSDVVPASRDDLRSFPFVPLFIPSPKTLS